MYSFQDKYEEDTGVHIQVVKKQINYPYRSPCQTHSCTPPKNPN